MTAERGQLPTWFRTRDFVAERVGKLSGRHLSDRTLRRIKFVMRAGVPQLVAAMDAGEISIAAAAQLARMPSDMQVRCLADRELCKHVVRVLRGAAP